MYNSYFGFQKSPFGITPDPSLFYSNAVYQEAFAALRYGIREKKGFILITGEAGTGKTILLRKLMRSIEETSRPVFIFNPHLSFTELLQLILRELGLANESEDNVTMIEELKDHLIERLKMDCTVALLIDEAQDLSDETLEGLRLFSNLETEHQKLLQIVLVGQPELEIKLDQSNLRHLKQRVALRCRLTPLKSMEVGSYIDFRLQAAGYHKKKALFHRAAVEQIAWYSMGIPRLINVICDNALLAAYASSKKQTAAEMIHEVAADLGLSGDSQNRLERPPKDFGIPTNDEAILLHPQDELWDELGQAMSQELAQRKARQLRRSRQQGPISLMLGLMLVLFILGGAGAAVYPEQARNYLSVLRNNIDEFIGVLRENIQQAREGGDVLKSNDHGETAPIEAPPLPDHALLTEQEMSEIVLFPPTDNSGASGTSAPVDDPALGSQSSPSSLPEMEKPGESQIPAPELASATPISTSELPDEMMTVPERNAQFQIADDPEIRRRKIQIEVDKAIRNRAIGGVNVSLIGGTAYLHGQVATERQKLAAEQAAHSVPAVRNVLNRIVVK
jgi:type II secretory pathway predicted ATPase ExeA